MLELGLSPDFMPHGYCYLWNPWIVWLHVISDSLITFAYYCIPAALVYFIRKQRDLSFNRIFWMFAVFILACGTTHFMEVWNVWHASYLIAGMLKAVTAVASVATALVLLPLIPKILSLQAQVHLQEINLKLKRQIAEHALLREEVADAPLRHRILAGFVVAAMLIALSGFLSWRGQRTTSRHAEAALRDSAVINLLGSTLNHVVDVETGARGFSLTGEELFLEPYASGRIAETADLSALNRVTDNSNPESLRQLQERVEAAAAIAAQAVQVRRERRAPAGVDLFRENKKRVDAVRSQVEKMLTQKRQILAESSEQAAASARSTRFITLLGAGVGICFLGLAGIAVNREVRVGAGVRVQLWQLNRTLEQRVEERTAALQHEMTERKGTQESYRRMAAIVESSTDAIVGKDLNGIVTSWNKGAQLLFGYAAEEIVGHSILTLIPAERRHEEAEILGRIRHGGHVDSFETVRIRKDGKAVEISANVSPIKDAEGRVIGASKIARDITESKRIEAELQKSLAASEQALKELADQKFALDQAAIVAITDVQGTIQYVNDKFCAISQYSREELLGNNHRILNSGHHSREFFQEMYRTIASGKVWHDEIRNRAKDGSSYWVDTTIVPTLGAEGKPRQYVAIRADITQRKLAEQALREQAEVLDQAQVLVRDAESRIVLWTSGAERLYGFSRSEAVGKISHELLGTEFPEPLVETERKLMESGIWEGELTHYHRNGGRLHVASIWLLKKGDGKVQHIVEANNDITQRKRVEAELQQQQTELSRSNADLEQFAYAASHDLQEPLRAVGGCVNLLQARYGEKLDERAHEYMQHAVEGASRMQNLIDDLLSFSRVGTRGKEFQPVSCDQAVENALKNLSVSIAEKQAQVEHRPLPMVLGDLTQLSLVFQNLIGNALKFCGAEKPCIQVEAEKRPREWEIVVRDNGIGIDPQYFERIFVIFQRLHTRKEYPGTGMGLALCKKVIERHGGRIWVESESGKGTTFRFTLPAPPSEQTRVV
jgi:PAS domain S-box-containing protein